MDTKLEKYYEDMNETFNSQGWAIFVEENLSPMFLAVSNIQSSKTEQDFWMNKGRADVLQFILKWPETVRQAQKENEDEETAL